MCCKKDLIASLLCDHKSLSFSHDCLIIIINNWELFVTLLYTKISMNYLLKHNLI